MLRLEARGRDVSRLTAGALGSVLNRPRQSNGDTHVVDCDDVFSDAGSNPAASKIPRFARPFVGDVFSGTSQTSSDLVASTPAASSGANVTLPEFFYRRLPE